MNIQIVQKRVGQKVRMQNENFDYDEDIDPDLHNEVEIHFTARGIQSSAKSRQTMSRKSSRKSEAENSVPSSRIVKSRGRPMKPHETEPFLSIDNLPADKTFLSERSVASPGSSRPPTYRHIPAPRSPNITGTAVMSPYQTPRLQSETSEKEPLKTSPGLDIRPCQSARSKSRSSVGARSASRQGSRSGPGSRQGSALCLGSRQGARPGSRGQTPVNSPLVSPSKTVRNANHHVRSPFKHAVFKPQVVQDGRHSPSQELKERTTQAAFYINRLLAMSADREQPKRPGKLKKGKLKPLYPVTVEGPRIERCRGIVSEARTYGASPSRTLQRRIHLMNTIPNVHEYLMDHRPCTTESVHRTSVASSDDEVANMDDIDKDENMDSNRSIPDKEPYFDLDENQDNNSSASPLVVNEDINADKGPDMESRNSSVSESPTPRMFATELGTRSPQAGIADLSIPPHLQQFTIDDNEPLDPNQIIQSQDEKTDEVEDRTKQDLDNAAQKVRSASPSKSVRFAERKSEQNIKDIKQQTNIAKQQKERQGSGDEKKKQKKNKPSSESCKGDDIDENNEKDDDDGDKDENKSGQNPNQSKSGCAARSSTGSNKDNKCSDSKSGGEQASEGQNQKRSSRSTQPRSHSPLAGQNCSKFRKSSASKPHKNKLQVQSVIHGNSVPNVLGPESPSVTRSCSRSSSPSGKKLSELDAFSSPYNFLVDSVQDDYKYVSQRSKVKFMIEGEEPEMETIFVEDENDIGLRPDKDITFETIESELKSLRHVIQNKLFEQGSSKFELDSEDYLADTETDGMEKMLMVEGRNLSSVAKEVTADTMQTDYTDLIEKYRKKCMDRSEIYGAFSERLVTPRSHSSYAYSNRLLYKQKLNKNSKHDGAEDNDPKLKSVDNNSVTYISDSGHGSIDNVSELSKSASMTSLEVPRLNLEDCTSDLDLESNSDSFKQDDHDDKTVVDEEEFDADKHILEMVCDDLPPIKPKQEKERKETIRKLMKSHKIKREEDVSKLTVVATTKSLSKPPQEKLTMSRSSSVPFPPLCFTINARPPSGYLYYFAYGPDMNPNRFSSYIKREIEDRFWALLFGFSLVFNKKGSSVEAGGFANLEFNPLRSVEGCMCKITPEELEVLDKCVGYPEHYEHLVLPVWFSNSRDPEQYGVCQYCVPALTFIAQNEWTETESSLPCDYSLSQCIKSADICTQEYRESLTNMTQQIEASA